jgi:hypothetical protein
MTRAPVRDARALLDIALDHFERQSSSPSASGPQLERLALGLTGDDDSAIHRRLESADHQVMRTIRYTRLLSTLTPGELAVVRAARDPVGVTRRVVQVRSGGLVEADRHGGEILGAKRDFAGKKIMADDGCVFVEQPMPVRRTQREVAEYLAISVHIVRARTRSALDKVREAAAAWNRDEQEA